ncbi:30S ribosomal protein S6 [Marinibaculum pumilum]|uniref:Small ribosomal subunit protein bS6 n=1 Tax=Marinibaculum pumilum TaxID=1766165 RepID=A0ABV7KTR7_9PROT
MPYYETVFIVRQDVSGAQVESLANEFKELVEAQGGSVTKVEPWGLRSLAYRIKKNRKGHYTLMNIDAPPAAIAELERTMRINEDVLRYLSVRVDELKEGPSAILTNKGRDDRDRGGRGGRDRDRGDRGGRDRDRGDRGGRDRGDRGDRGDRPFRSEGRPSHGEAAEGGMS